MPHLKNIDTDIKKENLLSANYSHFKTPLEEAKYIARVFNIYFENNTFKK